MGHRGRMLWHDPERGSVGECNLSRSSCRLQSYCTYHELLMLYDKRAEIYRQGNSTYLFLVDYARRSDTFDLGAERKQSLNLLLRDVVWHDDSYGMAVSVRSYVLKRQHIYTHLLHSPCTGPYS